MSGTRMVPKGSPVPRSGSGGSNQMAMSQIMRVGDAELAFAKEEGRHLLETLEEVEKDRDENLGEAALLRTKAHYLQKAVEEITAESERLIETNRQSASLVAGKQEHVKVLTDQNSQLLALLTGEQRGHEKDKSTVQQLQADMNELKPKRDAAIQQNRKDEETLSRKAADCMRFTEILGEVSGDCERLSASLENLKTQSDVDVEGVRQALAVARNNTMEYKAQLSSADNRKLSLEHQMKSLLEEKGKIEEERGSLLEKIGLHQKQDVMHERAAAQSEERFSCLTSEVQFLRRSLLEVEEAKNAIESTLCADEQKGRKVEEKVGSLLDKVRKGECSLQRLKTETEHREEKGATTAAAGREILDRLSTEVQNRQEAAAKSRDALLEKSNLDSQIAAVEQELKRQREMVAQRQKTVKQRKEKLEARQNNMDMMSTRIESLQQDKAALSLDLKGVEDESRRVANERNSCQQAVDQSQSAYENLLAELKSVQSELAFVRRECPLDDSGRVRPLLIRSSLSRGASSEGSSFTKEEIFETDRLIERFQINEFLYASQQLPNPIPPVISKLAQLLVVLENAQSHGDQYLSDIRRSTQAAASVRQKNIALYNQLQRAASFRLRILRQTLVNMLKNSTNASEVHLFLAGLRYNGKALDLIPQLVDGYDLGDRIVTIDMRRNGVTDADLDPLVQMIAKYSYLRVLDLSANGLSDEGVAAVKEAVAALPGVSHVELTSNPDRIEGHSGNRLRITVRCGEQTRQTPPTTLPIDDPPNPPKGLGERQATRSQSARCLSGPRLPSITTHRK